MYYSLVQYVLLDCFFFFKQKTAYEMRMSDWSSDVCSSDLRARSSRAVRCRPGDRSSRQRNCACRCAAQRHRGRAARPGRRGVPIDRKSVVEGKSVSVRVDLGGRRIIKKKKKYNNKKDSTVKPTTKVSSRSTDNVTLI